MICTVLLVVGLSSIVDEFTGKLLVITMPMSLRKLPNMFLREK